MPGWAGVCVTAAGRLPPLPLEEVKQLEAQDVAAWLELPKAREARKYGCVWCDSSDAMEAYRGPGRGFFCFSCGRGGSTIDATMAKLGLSLPDAVKALASRFGVLTMPALAPRRPATARSPRSGPSVRGVPGGPAKTRETSGPETGRRGGINSEDNSEGGGRAAEINTGENTGAVLLANDSISAVYTATIGALTLTERGLAYLASRGLGFRAALTASGFRSIDGLDGWLALKAELLRQGLALEQIRNALTPRRVDPAPGASERHPLPWGGKAAVLVMPYRWRGQVVALRFRKLEARGKGDRYRDLGGSRSPLPYNADALDDVAGQVLHVCEGELDAWTLAGCESTLRVIGIPGVGQLPGGPDAPWLRLAGTARRILCWHDPDPVHPKTGKSAGAEGAARLKAALQSANSWTAAEAMRRVKRVQVAGIEGKVDVCDLWQRGELGELLASLPGDI